MWRTSYDWPSVVLHHVVACADENKYFFIFFLGRLLTPSLSTPPTCAALWIKRTQLRGCCVGGAAV